MLRGEEKVVMNIRKNLSNNVLYYRIENNLLQEALAEKMDSSVTYISEIENQKRNVSIDYIEKLAKVLNIEIKELFTQRDNVENKSIKRRKKI